MAQTIVFNASDVNISPNGRTIRISADDVELSDLTDNFEPKQIMKELHDVFFEEVDVDEIKEHFSLVDKSDYDKLESELESLKNKYNE